MQLTTIQRDGLLDRLIRSRVRDAVDTCKLSELVEWLAVELARVGGISDEDMLATARALTRDALACVLDFDDDRDLHTRYLNAICYEAVPELRASG
jgi:hypothetical protein